MPDFGGINMRPIERDYQKLCEYEQVKSLGLEDEKCARLLRRGTRRCHTMARPYLLTEGLNVHIDEVSKDPYKDLYNYKVNLNREASIAATTLSLIDVGAYSYSTTPDMNVMLASAIDGLAPTWQYSGLRLGEYYLRAQLHLDDEWVDVMYSSGIYVYFHDMVGRRWKVIFYPDHKLMTSHQYRRWADVYRKWQDKALAAMAARTL